MRAGQAADARSLRKRAQLPALPSAAVDWPPEAQRQTIPASDVVAGQRGGGKDPGRRADSWTFLERQRILAIV